MGREPIFRVVRILESWSAVSNLHQHPGILSSRYSSPRTNLANENLVFTVVDRKCYGYSNGEGSYGFGLCSDNAVRNRFRGRQWDRDTNGCWLIRQGSCSRQRLFRSASILTPVITFHAYHSLPRRHARTHLYLYIEDEPGEIMGTSTTSAELNERINRLKWRIQGSCTYRHELINIHSHNCNPGKAGTNLYFYLEDDQTRQVASVFRGRG